jgi:hypothetical protein
MQFLRVLWLGLLASVAVGNDPPTFEQFMARTEPEAPPQGGVDAAAANHRQPARWADHL